MVLMFASRSITMWKVCSFFCVFLFSLAVSALPPPAVVYSAYIRNSLSSSVTCHVHWLDPAGEIFQGRRFSVGSNRTHFLPEKLVDMGTWEARGIIQRVRCGSSTLTAPFAKVTSPQLGWIFRVGPQGMVSVGASSNQL